MAWKKGAVVIVKRGDQEWADAMEQSLDIQRASDQEVSELQEELKNEKRTNNLNKIHDNKFTNIAIEKVRNDYGDIKTHSRFVQIIKQGIAFIVYWVCVFIDKYLVIK